MQCPQCGFENRDDARFCKRCGQSLSGASAVAPPFCPACGAAVKPGARFCARCGRPLAATPAPQVAPPAHSPRPAPVAPRPTVSADARDLPAPSPSQPPARGTARWLFPLITLALMACLSCCGVLAVGVWPSLGETPPAALVGDPAGPDIAILVRESYLNRNLTAILPDKGLTDASLDVQPGNLIVTTARFDALFVTLELKIVAQISVVNGEIVIKVQEVSTGGQNLMDFLGLSEVTVGENFTSALRQQLENELGAGSQLLDISTDEDHIILKARL